MAGISKKDLSLVGILNGSIHTMIRRIHRLSLNPEKYFAKVELSMMNEVRLLADESFCKSLKKHLSEKHQCTLVIEKTDGSVKIKKITLIGKNILVSFAEILHDIIKDGPSHEKVCKKIKSELTPLIKKSLDNRCVVKCIYLKESGHYKLSISHKNTGIEFSSVEEDPKEIISFVTERIEEISVVLKKRRK